MSDTDNGERANVGPVAKEPQTTKKKKVLVVGDMQNDYDTSTNIRLYGKVLSPYANNIIPLVPAINRIRNSVMWDKVVFTLDWLSAEQLTGRTRFCMEGTVGAELLSGLEVDERSDVFFKKNSDDSFCLDGGEPENSTGCTRLGDVLKSLGFHSNDTCLYFVGQRFERCILKTVMHAVELGYESIIVDEGTYTKEQEPDPEWSLPLQGDSSTPIFAADVYMSRKSAGRHLAEKYLKDAGVQVLCQLGSL